MNGRAVTSRLSQPSMLFMGYLPVWGIDRRRMTLPTGAVRGSYCYMGSSGVGPVQSANVTYVLTANLTIHRAVLSCVEGDGLFLSRGSG